MSGTRKLKVSSRKSPKAAKLEDLTDKMQLFVKEYPLDLNPKQAAIRAGYSPSSATQMAAKMLNNPKVTQALRIELAKRAQAAEIDAKKVLYELALIAFSDPGDMFDLDGKLLHVKDMPEAIRKSIAGFDVKTKEHRDGESQTTTVKVKFWNKIEALNLIGKHLGILGSTVENKHLHLHSVVTNPYLNAPDEAILAAKSALTQLEHSVKGNIYDVG